MEEIMGCITKLLENGDDKLHTKAFIEGGGTYKGYEYLVTLNTIGFRCGYVAINQNHPLYNKESYDDIDLDVHGGLTFFDKQMTKYNCTDKWLGFDCGHSGDAWDFEALKEKGYKEAAEVEKIIRKSRDLYGLRSETIKDFSYVESECKLLIDQLEAS